MTQADPSIQGTVNLRDRSVLSPFVVLVEPDAEGVVEEDDAVVDQGAGEGED